MTRSPAWASSAVIASLVTVACVLAGSPAVASTLTPATASPGGVRALTGSFTPLATARAFSGTVDTTTKVITLAGLAGIPTNATAVILNTEVFQPSATGYVRLTPAGQDATVAVQEFTKGQTISNLVTVKLANGAIQVKLSAGSATVLLDVSGYYADDSGDRYTPLATTRAFSGTVDTTTKVITLAGLAGIPTNATAVILNTEVFQPSAAGYVRLTPAGQDATVAVQEFTKGQTISNLVTVKLANGAIQVKLSAGSATVLLDVSGYYAPDASSTFTPLATVRAFSGTVGTTARVVTLAGVAGVPAAATAVVVNTEVYQPSATGYVRLTPAGQDATVAVQEFTKGQTISNLVVAKVVGGKVQLKMSAGSATVLLDVAGYFLDGSSGSGFGNDLSWPQCGQDYPTDQAFGIAGLNDGLANNTNPCFASELAWAQASSGGTGQPKAALYINTGNPGPQSTSWPTSNSYPAGTGVSNPYGTCTGTNSAACAYMYGYARAYDDVQSRGVPVPTALRWWLDVETTNTWQSSTSANAADLEGMTNYLTGQGIAVGVYASNYQWSVIAATVAADSPLRTLPNWIAGSNGIAGAQADCSGKPLMSGVITMTQYDAGSLDYDVSCS